MKVLIVGASGKTGQVVLEQLQHTEYQGYGLIRDSQQASLVTQFNATPLLGDLTGELNSIIQGMDAIIFVAGSRGKDVEGVDYQGLVNMVDAAIEQKIDRFLYISSINIGKTPEQFVQELKLFYQQQNEVVPEGLLKNQQKPGYYNYVKKKTAAEEYLQQSSVNYTILRAGLLTQEPGSGLVDVTPGQLNAFGKVSRCNMAACFIHLLDKQQSYQKVYTVLDGGIPIAKAF